MGVVPLIAGDIEIIHMEVTDPVTLKRALESPITQTSHLSIKKGKAADFLKAYDASFQKYVVGEKYRGMWLGYAYEDPYLSFEANW